MRLTATRLPLLARQVYPTPEALRFAHQWWPDASDTARAAYRRTRLGVVRDHAPLDCEAMEIKSSGSTGRRKLYRWGPSFEVMDRFFHELVMDGDRLGRTAHLFVHRMTVTGLPNRVVRVEPCSSYTFQKHVLVELNGAGPVAGLRDELAGWNVFVNASVFTLLDRWSDVCSCLDRDGMLVFTGEALPADLEANLRGRGFDVRDEMRCWDGGATFYTCRYGNRHWVDLLADTWLEGDALHSSDLFNLAQPFLGYHNGDRLVRHAAGPCRCGQAISTNQFGNRTAQAVFNTPSGLVVTYDLLFNLFLQMTGLPASRVEMFCVGKRHADVDLHLTFNCLIAGLTDTEFEDVAALVVREMYSSLGVRATVEKYVDASYYKVRKIYWIDEMSGVA